MLDDFFGIHAFKVEQCFRLKKLVELRLDFGGLWIKQGKSVQSPFFFCQVGDSQKLGIFNQIRKKSLAYLNKLKTAGRSPSTVNRKLASVRSFYNYMQGENLISDNPARGIKKPRIEKKELEYLSIKEIDQLLDSPDDSLKGRRDRAILEVLYATGIKVSELIDANVEDVNFRMGFITCYGESSKTRIIPMGRPARAALEDYVYEVRDQLLEDNTDEKAHFVNY